MNETDQLQTTESQARAALEAAEAAARSAAAKLDEARKAVAAAESAFEADASDQNWRAVEAARSAAGRAELAARQADGRVGPARDRLEAVGRELLAARFDAARARGAAARFRETITPHLAEIARLDGLMVAALARIGEAMAEQRAAQAEANELAKRLGHHSFHAAAVTAKHVAVQIGRVIHVARDRFGAEPVEWFEREGIEPAQIFAPRPGAGESNDELAYFRGITAQAK